MEAPHGKNPQYFSGKIGTYFAAEIAKRLSETHDHATVQVFVSTNKGEPIRQPFLVAVEASIPIRQEAIGSITQEVTSRDYLSTLISGYFVPRVHSYPCQQAMP
jgi:S-adenosylmethionine synthetase